LALPSPELPWNKLKAWPQAVYLKSSSGGNPAPRRMSSSEHYQTNLNGRAQGAGLRRSSRQLTPLGQGGRTVLFEDVAAVEAAVVVEVVVD
jgi:hypothetical protein